MLRRVLNLLLYLSGLIFVILGSFVLVQIGRGYSYDFKAHRTTLNGLIVISSTPSGADIKINGKLSKHKTPYRTTLETGDYDVDVTKDGYQPWHKRIHIAASSVAWTQYVWMMPVNPTTTTVDTQATITGLQSSRDHKHVAYLSTGVNAGIWVLDTATRHASKLYTAQVAASDRPAEVLQQLAWSDDNNHLLLRSQVGDKARYQILALGSNNTTAITDSFKLDLTNLRFGSGNNWRELYWLSPEGLRKLDVGAQTVSAVLADNVVSYDFGADRILYVQATKLGRSLYSMDRSGRDKKELVQSLAESDSYALIYASYLGKDILAVLPNKARTVTLYTDIYSNNIVAKVISKDADLVSINADGRFINFLAGSRFGTYDLEKDQTYSWSSKDVVASVSWFDTYHLLISTATQLTLAEFDGNNATTLATATNGQIGALVTPEQRSVVFVQATANSQERLVMIDTKQH